MIHRLVGCDSCRICATGLWSSCNSLIFLFWSGGTDSPNPLGVDAVASGNCNDIYGCNDIHSTIHPRPRSWKHKTWRGWGPSASLLVTTRFSLQIARDRNINFEHLKTSSLPAVATHELFTCFCDSMLFVVSHRTKCLESVLHAKPFRRYLSRNAPDDRFQRALPCCFAANAARAFRRL